MEADLPFEILSYIFLLLYTDPSVPRAQDDFENTHKLLSVMTVCKRWKHVVASSPTLWTDIWLGHSPPHQRTTINRWMEYVEVQVNRSGNLPLNLNIMVECVALDDALRILSPHLSRCRWLGLRGPSDKDADQDKCSKLSKLSVDTTSSAIHKLLSSPFPTLKFLSIDHFDANRIVEMGNANSTRFIFIDAPNLISITSRCPYLKAVVKCSHPPPLGYSSLQDLSLCGSWLDDPFIIPPDKFDIPSLKTLRIESTDFLWQLLSALWIPNLENLAIVCDLAYWPPASELPINISPMKHLRRLEWHTYSTADNEEPSLEYLLRHSSNLVSFAYITNVDYEESWPESLDGFSNIAMVLKLLSKYEAATARLCPNLCSLHLVSINLDNVVTLIDLRPALERISLQFRKIGDVIVTGSRSSWSMIVGQMRWIKSRVEFEYPTLKLPIGLEQEEDVAWNPEGTTECVEGG
ncbi:hypothetical protein FS837_001575 [Tulasnella sp. UAMH 9824]|nr:hypothetical protein FS837_001575 [Tulasnella sp. UAMH 9824]